MKKVKNLPKEVLLYVFDRLEDGTPVYGVADNVEQIPIDVDGQRVGVYTLNKDYKFKVRYELN